MNQLNLFERTVYQAQHTPGPWKAIGDKIYSADRRQVAIVYPLLNPDNHNEMQCMPNSRLIAAAPEMLELLEALVSYDSLASTRAKRRAYQLIQELKQAK